MKTKPNKRELQKKATRNLLKQCAKEEFVKQGFLKTATHSIAKKAGVAHGTLFLHFKTRETLIMEIIRDELVTLTDDMHLLLDRASDLKELLTIYLDYLEKDELFFAVIARELPFYPPELRREIFFTESGVRGYFYLILEGGIKNGRYKEQDITMSVTFLFGTISYILANRESLNPRGSVIKVKKKEIIKNFLTYITK